MKKVRPSTHPGIILKEEFAIPLKLTQAKMAKDLHIWDYSTTLNELTKCVRFI